MSELNGRQHPCIKPCDSVRGQSPRHRPAAPSIKHHLKGRAPFNPPCLHHTCTPGCVSCMNSNSLFTTVFRNFQWLRRNRGYWPTTYLQAHGGGRVVGGAGRK